MGCGSGIRRESLYLVPPVNAHAAEEIGAIVDGLVIGLREDLRTHVRERAGGGRKKRTASLGPDWLGERSEIRGKTKWNAPIVPGKPARRETGRPDWANLVDVIR